MTYKEFFKYLKVKGKDGKERSLTLTPSQEEFINKIKEDPKNYIVFKKMRNR